MDEEWGGKVPAWWLTHRALSQCEPFRRPSFPSVLTELSINSVLYV